MVLCFRVLPLSLLLLLSEAPCLISCLPSRRSRDFHVHGFLFLFFSLFQLSCKDTLYVLFCFVCFLVFPLSLKMMITSAIDV